MISDREDSEALKVVTFVLMEAEDINPELIAHAGHQLDPIKSSEPNPLQFGG
jgi:hypothetical protein